MTLQRTGRRRIVNLVKGRMSGPVAIAVGATIGAAAAGLVAFGAVIYFVGDQATPSEQIIDEGAVARDPVVVTNADGLVCATGDGGQFCTLPNATTPSIGVTEWADGSVRITVLDPLKRGLSLVLMSGLTRTEIPGPGVGALLTVTRARAMPSLIQAVTESGEGVATYDGTRLGEARRTAQ
jgi:hypothetical protein